MCKSNYDTVLFCESLGLKHGSEEDKLEAIALYRQRVAYGSDPEEVVDWLHKRFQDRTVANEESLVAVANARNAVKVAEAVTREETVSKEPYTWKVSWNKTKYDYKSIISSFKRGDVDYVYQSKGLARMVHLPKEGDYVYVSCNKLKIMKCKVISEFREDLEEKKDIYNRGSPRNHTDNNTYLKMKILETFDKPIVLKGCQRTWCKYK